MVTLPPDEQHRSRMRRKKALVTRRRARATEDRGVLLVHTGNGKGKSCAAFGMVARALGHGLQVAVVQFVKADPATGEAMFFRRFPEVDYYLSGEGFTWETQNREQDSEGAQRGWCAAQRILSDPAYHLVVLDELNIALKYGYLSLKQVISTLQARPPGQHVVVTGRGARPELIALADTVTEMRAVKHAFQAGVRAQKGIER
nr:cob(I)yrinic acid a,c-diamide adenosyltransferase [Gammaproteobacteria bacterium]